jgi:glycosyltransferase involved in cell wall biosynthesis
MSRKLTIGMATYNDFHGLYFTIQSIRMYHKEVIDEIEFVIIDNNPDSSHGSSNKDFSGHIQEPYQYIKYYENNGTSQSRNKVFEYAKTPYVICMDSHILIQPGALKKLIEFYDGGKDNGNLLQGPLLYDDGKNISTHFDMVWRDSMWGTWGTDERGLNIDSDPFEIPAQGLGLFSCRKDSWLGFNRLFRGFGGEECYIHEKYKKNNKKTLCLPFLRWIHRFGRPDGVPYPLSLEDRIRNYYIGHLELGLDCSIVTDHFKTKGVPIERLNMFYINSLKDVAKK